MSFDLFSYFPALNNHLLPICFCLMSCCVLFFSGMIRLFNKKFDVHSKVIHLDGVAKFFIDVLKTPTLFLLIIYGAFITLYGVYNYFHKLSFINIDYVIFTLGIFEFISYFWVTFNFLSVSNKRILAWSAATNHSTLNIVLPYIGKSLDSVLFLVMINLLIPILNFSGQVGLLVDKAAQIFLIAMIGFFFYELQTSTKKRWNYAA